MANLIRLLPYVRIVDFGPRQRLLSTRFFAFIIILGCVTAAMAQNTATSNVDASPLQSIESSGNIVDYSAVECLHKAIAICNGSVSMADLERYPQFASEYPDIIGAIAEVATDNGLKSVVADDLSIWQLKRCSYPVILHVRGEELSSDADFFVLYLGTKDGQAFVAGQGSDRARLVPFDFLAARWNGTAVAVAPSSPGPRSFFPAKWTHPSCLAMVSMVAAVLSLTMRKGQSNQKGPKLARSIGNAVSISLLQAGALVSIAVITGIVTQTIAGEHLLDTLQLAQRSSSISELSEAQSSSVAGPIPEIDLPTAIHLHDQGVLFIDARDTDEYVNQGHISGALSVPGESSDKVRLGLSGVEHDRQIVVYCGKATCPRAHVVAKLMRQLGYTNISIYNDGWVKWPKTPPP